MYRSREEVSLAKHASEFLESFALCGLLDSLSGDLNFPVPTKA
jgi:hypothetical protein